MKQTKKASVPAVISEIISRGCIYYTVTSLLLYTGGMLFSTFEREWIPTLGMLIMLLAFTLLFAAINRLLLPSRLPAVLKLLIHYATTTLIFYVIFILWGGFSDKGSSVLVILLTYTVVYLICTLIRLAVHHVRTETRTNGEKYDTQFDKKA